MSLSASQLAVVLIASLHLFFAFQELYPLGSPKILTRLLAKKPDLHYGGKELEFTSMIVHNAGVYNAIVAAGLLASAWAGPAAQPVQMALLLGGVVAGVFGFFTLSKATLIQAILGGIALVVVLIN